MAFTDSLPVEFVTRMGVRDAEDGISGPDWLARLPRLVDELLDEWDLDRDGGVRAGHTAVALPVVRDGVPLVLKVGWPHVEGRAEHLALRRWDGRGAVRLVAADPARGGLLLERLDPGRTLADLWDDEASEVAGAILARLHVAPPPTVPSLVDHVVRHHARLAATPGVLPPRQQARALALGRELGADPAATGTLIHGDLHYGNVLAGQREPWLAIDPHPMAGHPGAELLPLLRNRTDELGTGSTFRYLARRRVEVVCDAAGIDEREARLWTIVMASLDALWAHEDGDRDAVSLFVALIKAMED